MWLVFFALNRFFFALRPAVSVVDFFGDVGGVSGLSPSEAETICRIRPLGTLIDNHGPTLRPLPKPSNLIRDLSKNHWEICQA
jgi:hypothetical protein